jgi:hypothetical protein
MAVGERSQQHTLTRTSPIMLGNCESSSSVGVYFAASLQLKTPGLEIL